jgi:hypothetical protein
MIFSMSVRPPDRRGSASSIPSVRHISGDDVFVWDEDDVELWGPSHSALSLHELLNTEGVILNMAR